MITLIKIYFLGVNLHLILGIYVFRSSQILKERLYKDSKGRPLLLFTTIILLWPILFIRLVISELKRIFLK